MNLAELIENLSLDLDELNPSVINREIIANYSDHDLIRLCEIFLRGIGKTSTVNGKIIVTLWGIADYYKEYHELSPRQQVYIIQNILRNWHQIGLEMRCQLGM